MQVYSDATDRLISPMQRLRAVEALFYHHWLLRYPLERALEAEGDSISNQPNSNINCILFHEHRVLVFYHECCTSFHPISADHESFIPTAFEYRSTTSIYITIVDIIML